MNVYKLFFSFILISDLRDLRDKEKEKEDEERRKRREERNKNRDPPYVS